MRLVSAVSVVLLGSVSVGFGVRPGESQTSGNTGHPAPFTIQQVLSAPFASELRAAPAKGRFAWVFNSEGRRNLWVAEPSADGKSYNSRAVTNYPEDDGQDIGEVQWTPDAESIVYVRGGDLESTDKPYPNPRGFAEGVEQDLWITSLHNEPRKLAEGHSPAVSPRNDVVAYIYKDQVWTAKLDGNGKAQQLIHSAGESASLRWSPDGSKLAFVTDRGDHSFVGVYNLDGKSLSYLNPTVSRDQEPVWSPDGKSIAFLRLSPSKSDLPFSPRRAGPPWGIWVASAATGKAREIWKASAGQGSVFHAIDAENELLWCAGDRIIFPWETSGWIHLYSVSAQGGAAAVLTPGDFEVESFALSPDGKTAVYSSNQGDIDRRHVWRVAVSGAPPSAVTSGAGIETFPAVSSDNRTIAVLRSDARTPLRPAVVAGAAELRDLAPNSIPPGFPAGQMVTPRQVIFSAADGMQIYGQLFLPPDDRDKDGDKDRDKDNDGGRHPAVVFFHGGSRRQMLLGWHYMDYYSNAYGMNQYLASRGYVVLSVNYRSGIGYGLNFREALNYGAAGASEFNDVEGAGVYLQSRRDVDPKRIGLWGGSYGGYLTALGLARASDLFAAGVDFHGVHDWNQVIRNFVPAYNPEARADVARLAWDSSPLSSVKTWRSPVLLIHGDDDRNVPFEETVTLAEALQKQGVEFEQLVFADEIHDFLLHRSWVASYSAASDFFDRHLGTMKKAAGE
jgi:dipeptidyl aminopeptidase/acylaminoacyl peptidase